MKKDRYLSMTKKMKFLGLPFIRGIPSACGLDDTGMRALTWSCSFFGGRRGGGTSKFEKWLDKVLGEKLEGVIMTLVMTFSLWSWPSAFMVLPLFIAGRAGGS